MSHHSTNYPALIHQRGFRLTPQRELILDCVCEAGGHTSLEEIHNRVKARDPRINLATVYRTLKVMSELGVLVSAETAEGHAVYEIAQRPAHHHLICRSCGGMIQVDAGVFQTAFAAIEREYAFQVGVNHLVIYGICKECHHAQQA